MNSLFFLSLVCILSVKGQATKSQTSVFLPFRCKISRRTDTFKRLGGIISVRQVWFSFNSQVQKKTTSVPGLCNRFDFKLQLFRTYEKKRRKDEKQKKKKKKERKGKEKNRTSSSILGNALMKHQEVFEKNEDRLVDIISALAEAKFLDVQGHLPLNCRLNLNLRMYLTISRAVSVYWNVSHDLFKWWRFYFPILITCAQT